MGYFSSFTYNRFLYLYKITNSYFGTNLAAGTNIGIGPHGGFVSDAAFQYNRSLKGCAISYPSVGKPVVWIEHTAPPNNCVTFLNITRIYNGILPDTNLGAYIGISRID